MRRFSSLCLFSAALALLVACGGRADTCPSGRRTCPGSTACVNTDTDGLNCGACGHSCMTGQVCLAATCISMHPDGGLPTDAGPGRDGAVPPDSGVPELCMPTCSASQRCCGTTCIARVTSVAATADGTMEPVFSSCGACGRACDPATASRCAMGTAGPACECGAGPACTSGQNCVNTGTGYVCQTDCGGHGMCAAGETCCGTGSAQACTNRNTDVMNCGGCGTTCSASQTCQLGHCVDLCGGVACRAPAGTDLGELCCGGTCVAQDASNCGGCGAMCDPSMSPPDTCGIGFVFPAGMHVCCIMGGIPPGFPAFCSPAIDGGVPPADAGSADAGSIDAGTPPTDAGDVDAGDVDLGP